MKPFACRLVGVLVLGSSSLCFPLQAQINGLTMLGHLDKPHGRSPQNTSYSSCWGYVAPDGKEYGFISTFTGMSVIDINSDTLKEVQFIAGPTSAYCYREIRTYKQYGYIVYDYPTSGQFIGIQIVDLSGLPNTVVVVKTVLYTDSAGSVSTSHTLSYSDGYLYCNGSSHYAQAGTVIFSLKEDPTTPQFAGNYEPMYLHDTYIRNDTLYGAAIYSGGGLYVANITDKMHPQTLGKIVYAGSGTHNSWASIDGKYVFTADEIGSTQHDMKVWALDSLPNSVKVAEWSADPTTSIHNVYGRGHYVYVSHYKAGVRVVDAHDPANPIEVGYYDTYAPIVDSVVGAYAGCWAVFPYFPSGRIIASDMETGMYLFRFDDLPPRMRVRLLDPLDSASVGAGFNFRWTSAANQDEDPHVYRLHLRGGGLTGGSIDTIFVTKDTAFTVNNLSDGDYRWCVSVLDEFTEVPSIDTFSFHLTNPVGVSTDDRLPLHFGLNQNYPNPFNPTTRIDFSLSRASSVVLKVYNLLGEEVRTLLNGQMLAQGHYTVMFNAGNIPSGMYVYRLVTSDFVQTKKMILNK